MSHSILAGFDSQRSMTRRVDSGPRDTEKAARRRDATTVRRFNRLAGSSARRLIKPKQIIQRPREDGPIHGSFSALPFANARWASRPS